MKTVAWWIAILGLLVVACSSPPTPVEEEDGWFKIRDRNDVLCVAVQEDNGILDLELSGEWSMEVESPYFMRVAGLGTVRSQGHEFRWDGESLIDVTSGRAATPGLCIFIDNRGQLTEQLPFK